jgi:hypothetical protein
LWHLPDIPAQQQRDQQIKQMIHETNRGEGIETVDKGLT